MARQFRSRLARKESGRLVRQSVLLVVLTIVLIVALLFWGIPALVRFAGFLGDLKSSNQPIGNDDTIAPVAPHLTVPFEATPSAQISISGFAEEGATLTLFKNGNKVGEQVVGTGGNFEFVDIVVDEGDNEFSAQAVDGAGNQSQISKSLTITHDQEAPEIEITEPEDGSQRFGTTEQVVMVKGTTEPKAKVYINDRLAFVNGGTGEFSLRVNLVDGENKLMVKAVDEAGNLSEKEITVSFRE